MGPAAFLTMNCNVLEKSAWDKNTEIYSFSRFTLIILLLLLQTDYEKIPTTVFTPLEYGCIGLSEEDATAKYGADDIEVYHAHFTPLEWTVPHREENACYAKLICVKSQKVWHCMKCETVS